MASLQSNTIRDRRPRLDFLWLMALFIAVVVALASGAGDAAAQSVPNRSNSTPVAPAPPDNIDASAAPVAGPSPDRSLAAASPDDKVVDVKVAGNKSLPLEKILPSIRTRAGRPFDLQLIAEDVRRLDQTRQFVNVKTYWQKVPGGRIVIFEVIERPLLQEVKFIGCYYIGKKKLQKEADLKKGDPADPNAIEEARRKLEELYHTRGYNNASVMLLEGSKPEDRRAIFVIDEGVKQKVWKREFVGNTIASGDRLATQIGSKPPFLMLFGGEFDRKKADEDKDKLTAYYRNLGFFRARIGCEPVVDEKENWVTLRFVIDEGPRYKIRNVSIIGNKKYANDELMTELKLNSKDYFNQDRMTVDVRALQDKYGGVGYVFADVKPDLRFLEEPGQLDLVYNISEGDRYRVGRINIQIKGDYSHTQENTVRNRLYFKPGDIVDIREIRASEVALKRSGLFETNPAQGNAPRVVFSAPDSDGRTDENERRQQLAKRPKPSNDPEPQFRGQSPDSDSRERELDLTIDCGRLVGSRDESAPTAAPSSEQNDAVSGTPGQGCGTQEPVSATSFQNGRPCGTPVAGSDPAQSDLVQAARAYSEALARTRQQREQGQQAPRLQYLAPDDSIDRSRPLPQNYAPGDRRAEDPMDELAQKAKEYVAMAAANRREQQSRERLIETQYTGDPGRVNPATQAPLEWSAPTRAANPSGAASATGTTAANAPQAAPVTPSPAYGNDQWPSNAPQRTVPSPQGNYLPGPIFGENSPFRDGPPDGGPPPRPLDVGINVEEAMTGRLMFGVGVNSDAGLVGSVTLDEQNFDWTRFPNSWEDISNASAWRGAGQRFRVEAVPGTQVQRYMVTFTEPYMFGSQVSNMLSGYYYNRVYTEYTEQRLGGRIGFGYQFTPALSAGIAYRGAKVNITDPEDPYLPDLAEVTGRDLALHGFELSLTHDRRDNAFLATEGHLIQASVEQVLGSFQYPRAEVDLRKYFTLYERPDGSGRHVLSLSARAGWTDTATPIYERFYAGGFSTIRGFQFRGASPQEVGPSTGQDIVVGGDFQLLASVEYMFPITADDMIRGVVFCDSGTVEPTIKDWSNRYRVAPGFGLRICIPAMGPAPIALDFAFPVSWQPGDRSELFSFFVGFGR
jgi:outer membrane protein insertion porin family